MADRQFILPVCSLLLLIKRKLAFVSITHKRAICAAGNCARHLPTRTCTDRLQLRLPLCSQVSGQVNQSHQRRMMKETAIASSELSKSRCDRKHLPAANYREIRHYRCHCPRWLCARSVRWAYTIRFIIASQE